jgi:hypothetical protein
VTQGNDYSPAHWRAKAREFRAQAETLRKRAEDFDGMADRMEAEQHPVTEMQRLQPRVAVVRGVRRLLVRGN